MLKLAELAGPLRGEGINSEAVCGGLVDESRESATSLAPFASFVKSMMTPILATLVWTSGFVDGRSTKS